MDANFHNDAVQFLYGAIRAEYPSEPGFGVLSELRNLDQVISEARNRAGQMAGYNQLLENQVDKLRHSGKNLEPNGAFSESFRTDLTEGLKNQVRNVLDHMLQAIEDIAGDQALKYPIKTFYKELLTENSPNFLGMKKFVEAVNKLEIPNVGSLPVALSKAAVQLYKVVISSTKIADDLKDELKLKAKSVFKLAMSVGAALPYTEHLFEKELENA